MCLKAITLLLFAWLCLAFSLLQIQHGLPLMLASAGPGGFPRMVGPVSTPYTCAVTVTGTEGNCGWQQMFCQGLRAGGAETPTPTQRIIIQNSKPTKPRVPQPGRSLSLTVSPVNAPFLSSCREPARSGGSGMGITIEEEGVASIFRDLERKTELPALSQGQLNVLA